MIPFGIGFSEVLLILVVLLLVVGPQKLPEIARTLGKGVRVARRAGQELRDAVQLDEIRRNVYDHTVRPWQQATTDIEDAIVEPRRPKANVAHRTASATASDHASAHDPAGHGDHGPGDHHGFGHHHPDDHDPDEAAPPRPLGRGPGPVAPAGLPPRPEATDANPDPAARPPRTT
jgi:Tat protein translocase TatB subunit